MHSTSNLEDGYMGGGKRIKNSIKKHGKEFHTKEILEFFNNREDLKNREIEIVNEVLISDISCMNINLGGEGGWLKEWQSKGAINANIKNWQDPEYIKKIKSASSNTMKDLWANPETAKKLKESAAKSFKGKTHTEETKRTIAEKNSIAQKGNNNSQFGTCWMHNPEKEINKKVKKEDIEKYSQEGWNPGMKMKFFK